MFQRAGRILGLECRREGDTSYGIFTNPLCTMSLIKKLAEYETGQKELVRQKRIQPKIDITTP